MVAFQNFKRVVCGQEKSIEKCDSNAKAEKAKDSYRSSDQYSKPSHSDKKEVSEAKENNINILNKKQALKTQQVPT